jgi:tripartite-type tricarboxylate transporter receptor subunit TctC
MNAFGHLIAAGLCALALLPCAQAQGTYPSRPITLITAFAPGNGPDALVRALAQEITRESGATVVVEGKPGAGTFLAAQPVARAQPDGYTILVTGGSTFTSNRFLFKKLPYDPVKDFQPVTTLAKGPLVLLVNAAVPAKTVQELIALARKEPGKLTYAEASAGTRVAGELFQRTAGIQLTRVPYKSSTQAIPDLISGQINMMFTDMTALRQTADGRLRAIAVADAKRTALAPDLPTLEESGVKGMDSVGFTLMMLAPAGTPMPVVEKLRALVSKAARTQEVQPSYSNNGMYPFLTTPAEMSALIEREASMWREMVKVAGMEPQ